MPFAFDPAALQHDLDGLAGDAWIAHFVQQNYQGDWSVLPLRGTAGAAHPVLAIYSDPTATAFEDTPLLARCPNFAAVLARFACELQAVRLMRLTPGSAILEHSDHDLSVEDGHARIHVAVATNPGVVFELNRRRVVLEAGSAWYLRLSDPHRVVNHGATDRVHLVIDTVANDWLREMLAGAARDQAASASAGA
ncbi:MAG TPA: aspartyl/asparaginyl beta-hydroxylase domain-containing protein [Rhizomicrobium sp.]|nr:aspartyl/asparaginyl beta-hydroxylase domain-containing protein [Rhizomicrobium sp.]